MQQPETLTEAAPGTLTASPRGKDFPPWAFSLLFGVFVFAAFPEVLLGIQTFVIRDFGFFAYPLAHYQRDCFWRGELPLWNPFNHCGTPFLAQWNTMPLYPPALIYVLLPLPWSLNFFCLLHLFWAGMGMYFLARAWTGNDFAAAIAGFGFGFNGFALNLLMWPSHMATYSWMPWVVLLVERGWSRGGRALVLGALVGVLQMLAGGPETILFTWLILSALWLAQIITGWRLASGAARSIPHSLWRFPLMVILVAALAAAQLLPFLDLSIHSQRQVGFADSRWAMPSWGWANFLVPMVFGFTGKQGLFFQYGQYWTSSYYLGVGILFLALLSLRGKSSPRVWLLAGISVIGLLLATGDQTAISRAIRKAVPQLSVITYPVKYVALVVFSAPLLAAFGLATVQPDGKERRRIFWIACSLAILSSAILVWAWKFPFPTDNLSATLTSGASRILLLVIAAALVWAWLGVLAPLPNSPVSARRTLITSLLLLLFWIDVRTHEPQQNPSVPGWIYHPGLARARLAMDPQPDLGGSRVMVAPAAEAKFRDLVLNNVKDNYLAKRLGYFADCNLLDGIPSVSGFYSLLPRQGGELYSLLYVDQQPVPAGLMDFLGVSQVTSTNSQTEWDSRRTSLPLVTAGQAPVFVDDTNAVHLLLHGNLDFSKAVLLPPETRSSVTATAAPKAEVKLTRCEPERLSLETTAESPAMVVLSQTYYHCWRAYVDGKAIPLLRANYAFQAVQVPAGKHTVTLRYQDTAFRIGVILSGSTLVLICLLWIIAGRASSGGLGRMANMGQK